MRCTLVNSYNSTPTNGFNNELLLLGTCGRGIDAYMFFSFVLFDGGDTSVAKWSTVIWDFASMHTASARCASGHKPSKKPMESGLPEKAAQCSTFTSASLPSLRSCRCCTFGTAV